MKTSRNRHRAYDRCFRYVVYLLSLTLVFLAGGYYGVVLDVSLHWYERQTVKSQYESARDNGNWTMTELTKTNLQPTRKERYNLRYLQDQVQKSFYSVQYPTDCFGAKFFICDLGNGGNGFGSRVHQVVYCHFFAYHLGRVLILRNAYFDGLEYIVSPLYTNRSCSPSGFPEIDLRSNILFDAEGNFNNFGTVLVFIQQWGKPLGLFPPYMPGSVPGELFDLLAHTRVRPSLWYIGQSVHFLVGRELPEFKKQVADFQETLRIRHPYVAMQIRHSDKYKEAKLIPTLSYMPRVVSYFERNHPDLKERHVYVATDDPEAIQELQTGYPTYMFFSQPTVAKNAGTVKHNRVYQKSALEGLMTDLFMLTKSEFVVCTFSSNVGRLVHELRQAMLEGLLRQKPHYYKATVSMDSKWYFAVPGYLYFSEGSTWATAKRSVEGYEEGEVNFVNLTKNWLYQVETRDTYWDPIHVTNPNGFAKASDLYVYPQRTKTTEKNLREILEYLNSFP